MQIRQNLDPFRVRAIAAINEQSRELRVKHYTDLPAQGEIYGMKEAEARAYLSSDPEPATLDAFPLIKREVGKTAPTPYEVAQVYVNKAAFWREVLVPALEDLRMTAISAAETGGTIDAINQAVGDFSSAAKQAGI